MKPGDKVVDLIPGSGYFTKIFSKAVGPKGHVYMIWPDEYAKEAQPDPVKNAELAKTGYPNTSVILQPGAAFVNSLFTALINSPSWKDSIFIETFDENGGLFDHVSPMIDGRPILELGIGASGQAVGAGKYPTDAAIMHTSIKQEHDDFLNAQKANGWTDGFTTTYVHGGDWVRLGKPYLAARCWQAGVPLPRRRLRRRCLLPWDRDTGSRRADELRGDAVSPSSRRRPLRRL